MADKIQNLKNWQNNEKLNARDYKQERDKIANTVNTIIDEQTAQDGLLAGLRTDVDTNATNIGTNDTDIANLQNDKVNRAGDTITGDLTVEGTTTLGSFTASSGSIASLSVSGVNITNTVNSVNGLLDGSVRAKKAENTDDGSGNASTAQQIKEAVGRLNQDVKDTSTPEFQGVVIGDKTLTNQKLVDLDVAKAHADTVTGNPHQLDKVDIGLDQVDNTSDADKPISTATQTALDGKADLGEDGFVLPEQLPSYVDDILEFATFAELPATGATGKIYIVNSDPDPAKNTSYRWSGSAYFVFDQTTAEWGSISGTVTDQTDIENAKFTSTVSEGIITTTTLKESINELDAGLKSTNSAVSGNTTNIGNNATDIGNNTTAIGTNTTNIGNIVNGTTDVTFDPGDSGLTSTKVEAAIIEVQGNVDAVDTKVDNVVNGTTDITFDPASSGLDSTTVEAAIKEIYAEKGENNGIAPLDADGRIPSQHLTINAIEFKGTFGSTGSSLNGDLPTTEVTRGDMYICDEDNYTSVVAGITFNTGDKAIYDGTNWVKNDAQDAVLSVNSKTGAVTLNATEIPVDASGFNGELVNTDNTVQKALNRLDAHDHVEADITDLDKYAQSEVDAFLADKVDVGVLASNIILYPTSAASDVTGYNRAVTSTSDPDYDTAAFEAITPIVNGTKILVGAVIADADLFVGNPGVINIPIVGNIKANSNNLGATFYFEIYKRDQAGNEVFIGESDKTREVRQIDYEEFSANAILNDGDFLATDRLVFKFFADNVESVTGTFSFQYGGLAPVRILLNVPVGVTLQSNRIAYDTTNSTLESENLQDAMDELDSKVETNTTVVQVESFDIVNVDNGDGTFTYRDSNLDLQTGTIDAEGFYLFDLQVAGFYNNSNLVEVNINDATHLYGSDTAQLREGTPDAEGVVTTVKVKHTFNVNDEVDIKYYQGVNIVSQALGDGTVSFAKLNATLQSDIQEVRNASSTNASETLVKRNTLNEFQGILDGKFKTPRAITLDGDVSGSVNFDGSSGVTITTVVADDSHAHTNLGGNGLTYNTGTGKYDVDVAQLDDVLEFNNLEALQAYQNPQEGILYVTTDDNSIYRWTGSQFTNLGNPQDAINTHRDANYPHRFTDPSTSTVYEWGLGVENGELGIIYREVTE